MPFVLLLLTSLIALSAPSPLAAQTLGDIARQEEARRGTGKKAERSFTNADLKVDSAAESPDGTAVVDTPRGFFSLSSGGYVSAEEIIARSEAAIAKGEAAKGDDNRAEAYWRDRAQRIRTDRDNAQRQVTTLAAAQPASTSEQAVTKKALDRAQAVLDNLEQQWLKLRTQAGAAGVPKAWVQ